MNLELVNKIAKAVLYEGYMLYPYRASAVKNRQRWNFGAVYPAAFSAPSKGTDACVMETQCLIAGDERTTIDVRIKFLHLVARQVYEIEGGGSRIEDGGSRIEDGGSRVEDRGSRMEDGGAGHSPSSIINPQTSGFRPVESLDVDGQLFQTWQEAVEREAGATGLSPTALTSGMERIPFKFEFARAAEPITNADGALVGEIIRRQESIEGAFEVSAETMGEHLFKITVRIENSTWMKIEDLKSRDKALMRTLISTHTILGAREGEFVSLLDPPDDLREAVSSCANVGTYPVLVGEPGERNLMLSSPIILYDYPQIAPESAGELFDSTEIDEILTLRILTLTDEEKREMRNLDDRGRRILERTETMPLEQLMKLHGAVRGLRTVVEEAD